MDRQTKSGQKSSYELSIRELKSSVGFYSVELTSKSVSKNMSPVKPDYSQ
jgi:hypothetical protein